MRIVLGFDFWKLNLLVQIWIFGFRTFNLAHLERGSLIGSAGFFGYVGFKILDLDFCLDNFMSFSNWNIVIYVLYQFNIFEMSMNIIEPNFLQPTYLSQRLMFTLDQSRSQCSRSRRSKVYNTRCSL